MASSPSKYQASSHSSCLLKNLICTTLIWICLTDVVSHLRHFFVSVWIDSTMFVLHVFCIRRCLVDCVPWRRLSCSSAPFFTAFRADSDWSPQTSAWRIWQYRPNNDIRCFLGLWQSLGAMLFFVYFLWYHRVSVISWRSGQIDVASQISVVPVSEPVSSFSNYVNCWMLFWFEYSALCTVFINLSRLTWPLFISFAVQQQRENMFKIQTSHLF